MGLFVASDGHHRSWLAAWICCWSAVDINEHQVQIEEPTPSSQAAAVWDTQPVQLEPIPSRRLTSFPVARSYEKGDEFIRDEDLVRSIAERPPSLKPLEFGDSTLLGRNRQSLQTRQKALSVQSQHPSMEKLADSRRSDHLESRRLSLVPLKLNPVVLNREPCNSAMPVTGGCTMSTGDFTLTGSRPSYRETRESPYQRISRMAFSTHGDSWSVAGSERGQTMVPIRETHSPRSALSTRSSSSSFHSTRHEYPAVSTPPRPESEVTQSSASSVRCCRNMDTSAASTPSRPFTWSKRKRSVALFRKSSAESIDWEWDKEILELNTIVEERRAENARSRTSLDGHVPAVAPSMAGIARSETLNDIGSVFSRPIVAGSLPVPMTNRLSRPFTSVPEFYVVPASSPSEPDSSLAGWLSDLAQSPASDIAKGTSKEHTPLLRGRHISQSSFMTSTDDEDVPSLTAASTPTSFARGHNRSSTVDSRTAPASPPATIYEDAKLEQERRPSWRQPQPVVINEDYGVGMAL